MIDNKLYKTLERRAWWIINRWKIPQDPGDLISETFLSNGFNDENSFTHEMNKLAGKLKTNSFKQKEFQVFPDRVCRACKQQKESGWFRTWYVRGYLIFDSWCKPCKNDYSNNYKKKLRAANPRTPNKRNTVFVNIDGVIITATEYAKNTGVTKEAIYYRIKVGLINAV